MKNDIVPDRRSRILDLIALRANARTEPPDNFALGHSVAELLEKINETTERRSASWTALREALADSPELSEAERASHANLNRLFGELLGSYAHNLGQLDSNAEFVDDRILDQVVFAQMETTSFAGELEQPDAVTSDSETLLYRMDELEESNRDASPRTRRDPETSC